MASSAATTTSPPPQPPSARDAHEEAAEARIARGALALASAQPVMWAAGLATTILLPRFLGDQALGQYALAMAVAMVPSMIASMGIPRYLPARVAVVPERANIEVPAALILVVGASTLMGLLFLLAIPLTGLLAGAPYVLLLALVGMVLWKPSHLLQGVLAGREQFKSLASLNAAATVVVAGSGLAVLALGGDLVGYMAVGAVAGAAFGGAAWRLSGLSFQRGAWDRDIMRGLVRGGMPFFAWNVVRRAYGDGDRILLGFLSTQAAIGWYAAAYRITSVPLVVSSFITAPLMPVLTRHLSEPAVFQRTLRRTLLASLLLSVPCSALIFGLAPAIPGLLGWPTSFEHAVPLMMILALHDPIVALDMVLGTALLTLGREGRWLRVGVAAAFFNLGLNIVLIPVFEGATQNGAIAAAILTGLTELLLLGGAIALLPPGMLDRATVVTGGKIVLAGMAMGVVGTAFQPISLALAIAGSALAFAGTAAALGVFRSDDGRALAALFAARVSSRLGRFAPRARGWTRADGADRG